MTLEQFLSQYGLIALFLLATVEGDASLILAGMLAHRGVLSLPAVIVAGAAMPAHGQTRETHDFVVLFKSHVSDVRAAAGRSWGRPRSTRC